MEYTVKHLPTDKLRDYRGNTIPAGLLVTRIKTSYGIEQIAIKSGGESSRTALCTRLDTDNWVVTLFDGERKVAKYDHLKRGAALYEAFDWMTEETTLRERLCVAVSVSQAADLLK